ncbi:hypothetical protein LMG10661_00909 [Ralstonia syzygii subsp. syzygii]|nr:hypothetical protein LMG10661_00909 [Ralstonia syzygii subsp. syzygii]
MAMLIAIATTVFLVLFIAITWWAYSAHRRHANAESAMLPFLLPDEVEVAAGRMDASRPHQ